jgi:hypothetical protein
MRSTFVFAGVAAVGLFVSFACVACSSSETGATAPGANADSGVQPETDAGVTSGDAAVKGDTCEDACKVVSMDVIVDAQTLPLQRAQFGTETVDGGAAYHVEAHAGGSPACPDQNSPTPDRTLVVTAIPQLAAGGSATYAEGVRAAFFDFKTPNAAPILKASAVKVTVVAVDPAAKPAWIALDVDATFPTGTAKGHLYATFCDSLSAP